MAQNSRNDRIFYACQAVAIASTGTTVTANHVVHGVQSVGMTTSFNLEQVFEFGQIQIYDNVEGVVDVEVTVEKAIDGDRLMYLMASQDAGKTDLVSATKKRSDVYLAIYSDAADQVSATNKQSVVMNSGMYINSISYTYPVDGTATESISFAGNDRFWNAVTAGTIGTAPSTLYPDGLSTGLTGSDTPASGDVVRRVDVNVKNSTLPSQVVTQGYDPDLPTDTLSEGRHVQSITVSSDFGTENINELGRFGPYAKYASYPVEVTCEIEVMATSGDLVSVSGTNKNLGDETIVIIDQAGTRINLGTSNKLSSVSYTGGDTGGGNATITYSYSNFNDLTVFNPIDSSSL